MDSSLVLNFVIESCAVEASSCRASVRDSSMGPTRYLLAPYVRAEMPART